MFRSALFARHGATKLDKQGGQETVAGWSNEPLDSRGRATAGQMAAKLQNSGITNIFTSDLPRASQTAKIVGDKLHAPLIPDPRLRPQRIPETEGKQVHTIQNVRDYFNSHPNETPVGGESTHEAKQRQGDSFGDIENAMQRGEKPLVVTHSTNLHAAFGKKPAPGGIIHKSFSGLASVRCKLAK